MANVHQEKIMANWMSAISEKELQYIAPALFVYSDDPEDAALFMYREGLSRPMAANIDKNEIIKRSHEEKEARPPKAYWDQVKHEIFTLVCTDDKKYSDLRASLEKVGNKGTNVIVATISASVGSAMGVGAGVISGFCAVALYFVIKIGKESYCAIQLSNQSLSDPP